MIYFVRRASDSAVKIGTTMQLTVRLYALEATHGKLEVLGVMAGSYADEASLHSRFKQISLGGEWFEGTSGLLEFINQEGKPWDGVDEVPVRRPTKISPDAIKWARIASGYTGESMAEYVSRITVERVREDADRLHAEATADKPPTKSKTPKEK